MPKLVITEGEDSREVEIKDGDTLGRTAQNAVVLKVPEASRSHCRFSSERGSWFVEDLGSSNGTLVNGRRVTKFELQDGDEIRIGAVSLRFFDAGPEEEASVGTEAAWGGDDLSLEEEVFLVLGGAGREGEVVRLPDGTVGIGRNAKNAIVLKDASVSGDHARISRDGSRCVLTDLGSSNGSFVNGRKVAEADLASGDRLRFGNVAAVFGVGDPKDFAVATGEDAEAGTFTRAMEAQGLEDDASFEFKTTLPRGERI
jgi:pSer/pThr/pTyr-binding forkhead associated (FHA) protein